MQSVCHNVMEVRQIDHVCPGAEDIFELEGIVDFGRAQEQVIEESGDTFTREELESDVFKCKPNQSFKIGCEVCWCKANGLGARYCTRTMCSPKSRKLSNQQS